MKASAPSLRIQSGIGLLLILSPFHSVLAAQTNHKPFAIKQAFEIKYGHAEHTPNWGRFSLDGRRVFLLWEKDVVVLEWRTKRKLATVSFAHLPCITTSSFNIQFIAGRDQLVALYCNVLYLLDSQSLVISREIFSAKQSEILEFVAAPNGKVVAVVTAPDRAAHSVTFLILDTVRWDVVAKWGVSRYASGLQFGPDSDLLAFEWSEDDGQKFTVRTGVEVRRVLTGELYSQWWRDHKDGYVYIGSPRWVPGFPNWVATDRSQSFAPFSIDIWDVHTGKHVRNIPYLEVFRESICFAPDWSYAVGSVADDPEDTRFTQEFLVWEPFSGKLFYQSPKRKYLFFDHLAFRLSGGAWAPRAVFYIVDISQDSKHLLVIKRKSIAVYKVE